MRISSIMTLALLAGICSTSAGAQTADGSYGDGDSGAMPSIILPEQLTSPISGDFRPQDGGTPVSSAGGEETEQAPYSVEGEETLDPNTN